jgi:RNA polymerase sigma-70 factor (ECF subfamily)
MQMARRHLGVKARDVNREISIFGGAGPQVASAVLAARLIGQMTSPSMRVMKAEMKIRLQEKLDEMDTIDREIIALRHFEQLSLGEAAQIMNISHSAACNRYVRALDRLKGLIGEYPLK